MKKTLLVISMLLLMTLVACVNEKIGNDSLTQIEDTHEFSGEVIELSDTFAVILIDENESIRSSGDKVSINFGETDLSIGDKIIVKYDGVIMESYPLQVNVLSIEKQ